MEILFAVLLAVSITMTFLYVDMRWQYKQYREFMYKEMFFGEDIHKIPTEPLIERHPLEQPKRKRKYDENRSRTA